MPYTDLLNLYVVKVQSQTASELTVCIFQSVSLSVFDKVIVAYTVHKWCI